MEEGWTISTLKALLDERYVAELRFQTERDRRYTEVAQERAKALQIKEEADKTALGLQRDYQTYTDEKDNRLREQITSERGLYATHSELSAAVEKIEAILAPIVAYVASQQGRGSGIQAGVGYLVSAIVVANIIIGIVIVLLR